MFDLQGRLAVVTGAASGIGAGIAETLARAGAYVIVADRNESGAREQAERLTAEGLKAGAVILDLSDESSVVRAFAEIDEAHGAPWLLVNNAGLQDRELLTEGTAAFWDRMQSVNIRGAFLASREAGRAMAAAGDGGRIVNIASAALIGSLVKGHAAYAASKAALEGLTRACALDLAEHGITVNMVLPGGVITPGAMQAAGPKPEGPATRRPPLGMCEPQDIGAAVLFFALPVAARITNQSLAVEGGWSLT